MYYEFEAGGKVYKLKLSTRNIVLLEKRLGCNPLSIFGNGDTMPTITTMVNILHCSMLQYHHGLSLDDAYGIFDAWLEDGHGTTDFVSVILDIYKASGIIKAEQLEKN
jgi:hypothetical protein